MKKKFKYQFEIEEKTEMEADIKMDAAQTLVKKLSVNMLTKLAHIAAHDPVKVAMAKKFLGA